MLQEAAAAGGTAAAPGTAAVPLDASPQADPAAASTAAALARLVPPAVWQARADARLALTDKLLVQQQRRLPPLSALRGLLLYLQQQADLPAGPSAADASEAGSSSGSGSGGGGGTSSGGLLADAAARVAQLWGDASAVQRLAPPQQAYLTAALCGSLALLSRQQLERHPQLLALLLSGITTRLDSPLQASMWSPGGCAARPPAIGSVCACARRCACGLPPAARAPLRCRFPPACHPPLLAPAAQPVRRQAMRVGQALSALLDPSKPPMFAEEAEQLRQLLPEERWEPQQAQQAAAAPRPAGPSGAGASAGGGAPPAKLTPRQARREARRQRREQAAARREARELARREREQREEEGPLTETDSDDASGGGGSDSSISSSGSSGGSSSGSEFERYDLEESDEEDPAKSRLQVGQWGRGRDLGGAAGHQWKGPWAAGAPCLCMRGSVL